MTTHRGMTVTLALMIGVPALTLMATAYQMFGMGDGMIRPAEVTVAPTVKQPAKAAQTDAAQNAPRPATPPGSAALPAIVAVQAAPPVPGRSALDFTAPRANWEAHLAQDKANADAGRQLAQNGKPQAGVQACVICHGASGMTPLGGAFPNLAGLTAEYMAKQLWDFRDGHRKHPVMATIAKGMTEQDIGDVSRYYGGLADAAPAVVAAAPVAAMSTRSLPGAAQGSGSAKDSEPAKGAGSVKDSESLKEPGSAHGSESANESGSAQGSGSAKGSKSMKSSDSGATLPPVGLDAARLDITGDGGRGLPACANCHGMRGRGEGVLLPRLAGQPAVYFVDQMNGFRSGDRANDDVGVMRAFAARLTPEEIVALARYYEAAAPREKR